MPPGRIGCTLTGHLAECFTLHRSSPWTALQLISMGFFYLDYRIPRLRGMVGALETSQLLSSVTSQVSGSQSFSREAMWKKGSGYTLSVLIKISASLLPLERSSASAAFHPNPFAGGTLFCEFNPFGCPGWVTLSRLLWSGRKSCEAASCIAPLHGKGVDSQMGGAGRSQGVYREKGPLALMKLRRLGHRMKS